jgi:sodium/bile acid cotransporter 7
VIQNIWPKPVAWFRNTFYLAKVGSMCLITVIWQVESLPSSRSTTNGATCRSTFSGAFYAGAFQALSTPTIIVVLFVNIGLYVVFSIFLFTLARLIPFPSPKSKSTTVTSADGGETVATKSTQPLFDPSTTIALMFCGPAKGIVLGGPYDLPLHLVATVLTLQSPRIVNILYGGIAPVDAGMVTVPLVLYQGSQVVLGQIVVALLKAWMRRVKLKEAREGLEGIEEKKEVGEEVTVVELEADEDGERTRAGSIEGKK